MSLFSKIFLSFGAFLALSSVAYAVHAQEYAGLTMSLAVLLGALLIGLFWARTVRRAQAQLIAGPPQPGTAADDEAHVKPTIWPLVFAVSSIGFIVGTVVNRWVLIPGGVLFALAGAGWVLDIQRQWRQHATAAHGAHQDHDGADGQVAQATADHA